MGVANSVTGGFIQKARMHCLLYGFVLCMESFGGTDEVAEKKDAASQIVPESRRIEEKDLIFFNLVQFCCGISWCMRLKEVELVKRDASEFDEDGAGPYAPKPTKFRIDLASIWAGIWRSQDARSKH